MDVCCQGLRHTYRTTALEERTVLDIASWQACAGEQVLLRGISGSGKTTLLNILAGLLPPPTGTVRIGGQSLYELRESQRDRLRATTIGYIFQMHHLAPTLTALENVEMPLVFGRQLDGRSGGAPASCWPPCRPERVGALPPSADEHRPTIARGGGACPGGAARAGAGR